MAAIDLAGKTTVVLDVHGILYQVFHTMREMSGPKGQPTGATFGFIRDVMNILTKFGPDYAFCAFDLPGKTFRHDFYPEYKANRPPMPEDLRPQMIFVRELVDALCVARLEKEGFEADDLLATVAARTEEAGGRAVLVTSDKDARQLITDNVTLYNLRKELLYGAAELQNDWGIRPDQVIDFQTMVGDSTDNIPGIPLIGPKGASALLKEFGTLEEIYAHLDQIKGKKGENLAAARDSIETTRRLVRLDSDVPIDIDWEQGTFRGVDPDRLGELFREFGFRSLLSKIEPLVERFGTAQSKRDPSLTNLFNLTEKKDASPAGQNGAVQNAESAADAPNVQKSLFDSADDSAETVRAETDSTEIVRAETVRAERDDPDFQTLDEENAAVTESLFRVLDAGAAARRGETADAGIPHFPETDAFGLDAIPSDVEYRLIDSPERFDAFLTTLRRQRLVSVDLETVDCEGSTKVRPRFAQIAGIAFSFDAKTGYYLPIRGPAGFDLLPEKETLDALRPILESTEIQKIGQNIKFDMIVLRNVGIRLRGVLFDTMVADYLLHSGERRHNLDELAENYLGYKTTKISELIGTGKSQKKMSEVPTDVVARYAGEDALVPWFLYPKLLRLLRKEPKLLRLLTELEIPLIDVLAEMESNGIGINPAHFETLSETFAAKLAQLEIQIRDLAADADPDPHFASEFNINSTQQLQRILFDDLKLPVVKKTKTGRSTDFEVLEELAACHPLPAKLIEHRQTSKLKGTYIDPIPILCHPVTRRVHASFNQVVTATGRLSASDPNLQNIPVRTEEGRLIRAGFVPDRSLGYDTFVSCDYSQIELRVLTHFSKDKNLTIAFENDVDIHSHVASELFGVPLADVTSEMRRKAKGVNFGLVYGQSAFGLAKALGIPQSEAADYIRKFFQTYPGIGSFLDRILEECRRDGFVRTILGRRRAIEGVRGARGNQQLNMAERTAINTVIQGSAADLMKLAMVNVSARLTEFNAAGLSSEADRPKPEAIDGRRGRIGPITSLSNRREAKPAEFLFDMEGGETDAAPNREPLNNEPPVLFVPASSDDRARLLLQIHDELLLETRSDLAPDVARLVTREMELGQPLSIPLKIDAEFGDSWDF